jgi:hypothetical protein
VPTGKGDPALFGRHDGRAGAVSHVNAFVHTIGRSPMKAAPTAIPVNPYSAIGLSITLFGPNF